MSKQFILVAFYVDRHHVNVATQLGAYDLLGVVRKMREVGAEITHVSPGRIEARDQHVFYRALEIKRVRP